MTAPALRTPTQDQWYHFQLAYDYLNEKLFDMQLPHCILNFATHGRSKGYCSAARWERAAEQKASRKKAGEQDTDNTIAHEISLNPLLLDESTEVILSWLARLMTQLWQLEYGDHKPKHQGYYNREMTLKLEEVGIPASDDATPQGKKTGFRMRHWIEKGGKFDQALQEMPAEYFPWRSKRRSPPATPKTQFKYACPVCETTITAGREISAICNTKGCGVLFELAGTK